ncbi:MAG TPA: hypothetical protein PLA68_15615 [Panacibacter sp.]|nr:hypothetical protein [Panacibacter sp.]
MENFHGRMVMVHSLMEGHRLIDRVCKYVLNQKEHHQKQSFKTEYISLLKLFGIEFKDEYLFEFYD